MRPSLNHPFIPYERDTRLENLCIMSDEKQHRTDNTPEKRVELHLHTKMSQMDALTDTKEAVKRAISWGHPAIAITDHGVAHSFSNAWKAADGKIKVLLGTEAYFVDDTGGLFDRRTFKGRPNHLILLAKNRTGLRNLYKLISMSHLDYFKRVPIIPKHELMANREGLILGSACEAGELYQAILRGKDWEELCRIASFYDYLEIQPLSNNAFLFRREQNGGLHEEDWEQIREWNRRVVQIGETLGKPVCATGDVHFMDPEDEVFRHILLDSRGYVDADAPNPCYFRTTEEMLREFDYLGAAKAFEVVVTNTNLVASWCEEVDPLPDGLFLPELENSDSGLSDLVWKKAHTLYGETPPQIVTERIRSELTGIIGRNYDATYLAAQKLVQDSLAKGYPAGYRGSLGASLVAFLSGITEVNPLPPHYRCPNCKHSDFESGKGYGCGADLPEKVCPVCGTKCEKDGFNIPFETFHGLVGEKVPDISLTFSGEHLPQVFRCAEDVFGKNHVFRQGTIETLSERTAHRYVKEYLDARNIRLPKEEENRLALGCTGVLRSTGVRSSGIVIIPQDHEVFDFCPVQHPAYDTQTDIISTHFDYHEMEKNLLKLDALEYDGLSMLRMMEELTGVNAKEIPLDDRETLTIFSDTSPFGYTDDPIIGPTGTAGVPEFDTKLVRKKLSEILPDDFDTLVRISGFSHSTDVWEKNARELILQWMVPIRSTVSCRDDIMLYLTEQGVERKTAFDIMEAVRKGKVKMSGFKDSWMDAMRRADIPQWYIDSLAKIEYLFPRAHAAAYVITAFRIAWFKVHEPLAFYKAYFSVRAKALNKSCMCMGMESCKSKIEELLSKEFITTEDEDVLTMLEVCYEFYLRGFSFEDSLLSHTITPEK